MATAPFYLIRKSDGTVEEAYSYSTCIFVNKQGLYIINDTVYSKTSSKHMRNLMQELGNLEEHDVLYLQNLSEGITRQELLDLAEKDIVKRHEKFGKD
jgi:hypothetical protein